MPEACLLCLRGTSHRLAVTPCSPRRSFARWRRRLGAAERDVAPDLSPEPEAAASLALGRTQLVLVAAAFGSLTVALRFVFLTPDPPSASVLSAVRGLIAAMCFAPLLATSRQEALSAPPAFWRAVRDLTFLNFSFQALLNLAVLHTDATRASFIFQGAVVFTPLLASASGQPVAPRTWAGAGLAAVGVALLALDGAAGGALAAGSSLNVGDGLSLAAAALYSVYILRMSALGAQGLSTDLTQALKCACMGLLYLLWFLRDLSQAGTGVSLQGAAALWPGWTSAVAWAALAYSAVVPGALADVMQARGQSRVGAAEAQVLLSAEPLWTALLSVCLLGETLSPTGWLGGATIMAALAVSSGAIGALLSRTDSVKDAE